MDVDSFHFTALDEKLYKCEVCAPGYIAPELVKKCKETTYGEYAGETFNKMTDRFSLAVHIFRLLFNGAHPYNCQEILSENSACISTIKSVECRVLNGRKVQVKANVEFEFSVNTKLYCFIDFENFLKYTVIWKSAFLQVLSV